MATEMLTSGEVTDRGRSRTPNIPIVIRINRMVWSIISHGPPKHIENENTLNDDFHSVLPKSCPSGRVIQSYRDQIT